MTTFVFRLKAPRATFALDMTDEEREIMGRHAAYWQPLIDSGHMVIFGPVLDSTGSWGLGVVEAENEDQLRAFASGDPVVTSGTASIEVGKMSPDSFDRAVSRDARSTIAAAPSPNKPLPTFVAVSASAQAKRSSPCFIRNRARSAHAGP